MSYSNPSYLIGPSYYQLLNDILAYLGTIKDDWSDPKIFMVFYPKFSKIRNPSTFDTLATYGAIGVKAKSETVGHLLLLFLRMIYNQNEKYIHGIYSCKKKKLDRLEMEQIVKTLRKYEHKYTQIFSLNGKIPVAINGICGEIKIEKDASSIDLWTLERIQNEFAKLLVEEKIDD